MTTDITRQRLEEALTRMLAGRPTRTDGRLTVANLCLEAGVGRDSFYRNPTIRARFAEARANHSTHQPELTRLREQLAAHRSHAKDVARHHADVIRELEQTVTAYANRIQTLALHAAELAQQNQLLRQQLGRHEPVRLLPASIVPGTTARR
jgi:hypothetical protein